MDRRIIVLRYKGTDQIVIDVSEGFDIFKAMAEQEEIDNEGKMFIEDKDPYYILDFEDASYFYYFLSKFSKK